MLLILLILTVSLTYYEYYKLNKNNGCNIKITINNISDIDTIYAKIYIDEEIIFKVKAENQRQIGKAVISYLRIGIHNLTVEVYDDFNYENKLLVYNEKIFLLPVSFYTVYYDDEEIVVRFEYIEPRSL